MSSYESIKIGLIPNRINGATQEIIVNVGKITSSPFFKLSALIAASRAAEPLVTEIAYFLLMSLANSSSNFLTNGPSDEIHPVSMHSLRYFL